MAPARWFSLLLWGALVGLDRAKCQTHVLDGTWITNGYGQIIQIKGSKLEIYETTTISCVLAETAASKDQPNLFVSEDGEDDFLLKLDANHAVLRLNEGSLSDIEVHRTAQLPASCETPPQNTALNSYNIFWKTFSEQYPFFVLRKTDWNATNKRFRSQISESTTPDELFNTLKAMIQPLQDTHTGINASSIHKGFGGRPSNLEKLSSSQIQQIRQTTVAHYIQGVLRDYCGGQLHFGIIGSTLGYFRIDGFEKKCEKSLDTIFQQTTHLDGLIIDERINEGGSDEFGLSIASRLTSEPYFAFSKQARNDIYDADRRTDSQLFMVQPSDNPGFRGPVILLTGPESVSAAETFAMALMNRSPSVIRVGESTRGVFSDVLERRLPNGWHFFLPNEIFLTRDGRSFDGVGLAPDVHVAPMTSHDVDLGRDEGLLTAVRMLETAKK
jgi:hypothetical protein